jgi:hypothetical protein
MRLSMHVRRVFAAASAVLISALLASTAALAQNAPGKEEAHNMRLVGYNDLQGRSAYQPVIQRQGDRWIAYIGHHGGHAVNSITGKDESNGTSVVDVTDPKNPRYIAHIPGEQGEGEAGGAQMVRTCSGSDLPKGVDGTCWSPRSSRASSGIRTRAGGNAIPVWRTSFPACRAGRRDA